MESMTSTLSLDREASCFASFTVMLVKSGTSIVLPWFVKTLNSIELTNIRTAKNRTASKTFLTIQLLKKPPFLSSFSSIFINYFPPVKSRSNAPSPIRANPIIMIIIPAILFSHIIFFMSKAFLQLLKNQEKKNQ